MTQDEKAKAYDMALEAARKELGVDRKEWEVVQQVLHNIFPQLCESEDEKIRKAIIRSIEEDSSVYEQEVSKEQMLAYLEKQKEQMLKEAEECELYWDGYFLAIDLNMTALGYSEGDKVRIIIVKE